jgi:hypothetical protein
MSFEEMLEDEITPHVVITLGKKDYRLAFSMGAVLAFKQKTGRNMFVQSGWDGFNLKEDPESILAFFWSALQTFHPEITYEKAGRMANFSNMGLISQKCNEALTAYLPKPPEEKPDPAEELTKAQSIGSGTGQ